MSMLKHMEDICDSLRLFHETYHGSDLPILYIDRQHFDMLARELDKIGWFPAGRTSDSFGGIISIHGVHIHAHPKYSYSRK